jgi:methylenetetrahydrofolate dehydrogenase (NADP+)/methenyltetrahydrofolate cyclohydrolase
MSALILDGKALAKGREQQLQAAVKKFKDDGGLQPVLTL